MATTAAKVLLPRCCCGTTVLLILATLLVYTTVRMMKGNVEMMRKEEKGQKKPGNGGGGVDFWTELARRIWFLVYWQACVKAPQPIHEIAGYKVLLQSLLSRSLHSLEPTVQVWRIIVTWNARCWEMTVFVHELLPWPSSVSHQRSSSTSKSHVERKEPATELIFRKFLSVALSFPNSRRIWCITKHFLKYLHFSPKRFM